MPSLGDRQHIHFGGVHTIANAVATNQRIPCLLFECRNDQMQPMPLKWPMMNHTSLDHGLVWSFRSTDRMHWMYVATILVCSKAWSWLLRDVLAPWCPAVTVALRHMYGPKIRNSWPLANQLCAICCSHCRWDFRQSDRCFAGIQSIRWFCMYWKTKFIVTVKQLTVMLLIALARRFALTKHYNYHWSFRMYWEKHLCVNISALCFLAAVGYPDKMIHNLDSSQTVHLDHKIRHNSKSYLKYVNQR